MDSKVAFNVQSHEIKESLLEQLSSLLDTYSQDRNSAFPEAEMDRLLHAVQNLLKTPYSSPAGNLQWSKVLEIGCPAGLERDAREEYFHTAAAEVVEALAGQAKAFAIQYATWNGSTFSLGISEENAVTEAVLCAACGHVRALPSDRVKAVTGSCHAQAECVLTFADNGSSEQKLPADKARNWLDSVAAALPDKKYDVSIHFDRVDKAWIDARLAQVQKLQDWLESYRELSWQASGNVGIGTSDTGSLFVEAKKVAVGAERDTANSGMSVSFSRTLYRNDVKRLGELLQYHATRLAQMARCGAHLVTVSANAESKACLSAVQSILGGVLAGNGISLQWSGSEPAASVASIFPDHALELMFSLPRLEFPNFSIIELEEYALNPPVEQPALVVGKTMWNGTQLSTDFTVPLREWNRHAFICGMTGSGKTNTVCCLLSMMGKPFLVIEPVKGEYRALREELDRQTEVYTLDVSGNEMLAINPLWFPIGGSLQYHIDSIKTIISSAFDLYAAMPNILEQCLLRTYVRTGWNLVTSRNLYEGKLPDDRLYPTISDLCEEIELYLNDTDFEGEAKGNYKGALLSRLQSFTTGAKGILLNRPAHLPFERWIKDEVNVILELDAIADDADKCIIMGTILTQYFQYVKYCTTSTAASGLKHVLVLEEAHHLFAEGSGGNSEGTDAQRQLVESLSNMLAEIRAYGEGIMIVDQSPTRISPEVIKNTAVKIVHRVDYGKDLDVLKDALLLRENDRTPARLEAGQALIRCGGMRKPAMITVPPCEAKERLTLGEKRTQTHVSEECLLQSAMDTIERNEAFSNKLTTACGLFANQALYDGYPGIQKAIYMLWAQVDRLLNEHGYTELARENEQTRLIRGLVLNGTRLSLKEVFPEQSYLCGIIEMYIERLIVLMSSGNGLRQKDWLLLADYRESQIHNRILSFYSNNHDSQMVRLRGICGVSKYLGLLTAILPRLQYPDAEIEMQDPKSANPEKLCELVGQALRYCFYLTPERSVVDIMCALLTKYMEKKG